MFSLIVTIIAIALVAALAIATIYYGGEQFLKGSAKAKASTAVNAAQQINGADSLYALDHGGSAAANVNELVSGGYLQAVPTGSASGTWTLDNASTAIQGTVASTEVCDAVNGLLGNTTPADVADAAAAMTAGATGSDPYMCVGDGSSFYFVYK